MSETGAIEALLRPAALFEVAGYEALLPADRPVWEALNRLGERVAERAAGQRPTPPDGVRIEGEVWLGHGVEIQPNVLLQGPLVIEDGAQIRQGALVRPECWIGAGCVVGHCTELKHSLLLPGAAAPHFNYVGDSILGRDVNLGAGTVLSNVRLTRDSIRLRWAGRRIDTGLTKLGAILGDRCQTGCHSVLNPGTIAGPGCMFYPQVSALGYFPPGTVVARAVETAREERS